MKVIQFILGMVLTYCLIACGNKRDFSPLFGRACFGNTNQEVLERIIQVETDIGVAFQLNDTLLVNISNYRLELEE